MSLIISLLLGAQIALFSNLVVDTILETFKQYPYLLQGEVDYNVNYFKEITTCHHGALAIAKVNNTFAGFLMGCPMAAMKQQFTDTVKSVQESNINIADYYYYSDIVVLPAFQKQHIACELFAQFEKQVKSWGYKGVFLMSLVGNENHPLKPAGYRNIEYLWKQLGFKATSFQHKDVWPTILNKLGTVAMQEHTLAFWIKNFDDPNCIFKN